MTVLPCPGGTIDWEQIDNKVKAISISAITAVACPCGGSPPPNDPKDFLKKILIAILKKIRDDLIDELIEKIAGKEVREIVSEARNVIGLIKSLMNLTSITCLADLKSKSIVHSITPEKLQEAIVDFSAEKIAECIVEVFKRGWIPLIYLVPLFFLIYILLLDNFLCLFFCSLHRFLIFILDNCMIFCTFLYYLFIFSLLLCAFIYFYVPLCAFPFLFWLLFWLFINFFLFHSFLSLLSMYFLWSIVAFRIVFNVCIIIFCFFYGFYVLFC